MRISVVISTYNRVKSLRTTLDALRHQRHRDFEVVVVNGPSDDGTAELLAERAGALRVVDCPERKVGVSRNLGVDAAAGEVVALIDDDAVPEPGWLADLAAAYDSDRVGGAGGRVLDGTGVLTQYRYATCDRIGRTDFDARPPFGAANRPGADPFVYFQGTSSSYRRSALEAIGGFDEHLLNYYDDVDVCAQVIDLGLELRPLEGAVVHHHKLPSTARRDPYTTMADRAYFALRSGAGHRSRGEALAEIAARLVELEAQVRHAGVDTEWALGRAREGFSDGLDRGLAGARGGRPIAPADPGAFLPYPTLEPGERVCFLAPDPEAVRLAATGAEVHVLARGDDYRVAFEDGVWVHRVPAGAPLRGAYDRAAARFAFDRVVGEVPPEPVDPARFPYDVEGEVLQALRDLDPAAVAAGVYAAVLRRPATPEEIFVAAPHVAADPNGFVQAVATSDEARRLEHDLGFLERLPERPWAEVVRDRAREQTRALVLGTERETAAELRAAPDAGALIAVAYRRLLGREPDPGADGLRVLDGPAIVFVVGTSDEARERGVPHEVVERLMSEVADHRVVRLRRR